jgi:excisionase family DNA binding protein
MRNAAESRWLTPKEAAEYVRCSVVTLRRAVQVGRLPAYPINGGRHVRFRSVDLDRWIGATPVQETRA